MHQRGIIHCDLKGANIVVSSDGTAMLIDFGLSFFESDSDPWVKNIEDTLDAWAWRAPEYPNLSVETPTRKSDVYSLGMVIIEAVTGRCPWSEYSDTEIREFLRAGVIKVERPEAMTDAQWALVQTMVMASPADRPELSEVVSTLETLRGKRR